MPSYRVSEVTPASVVVAVDGQLVGGTPPFSVPSELRPFVEGAERRPVVLDLSGLEFVDLEGVGMLLSLWRECRRNGRSLRIRGAEGSVRGKLQQTGVLGLLERGGSAELAADATGGAAP